MATDLLNSHTNTAGRSRSSQKHENIYEKLITEEATFFFFSLSKLNICGGWVCTRDSSLSPAFCRPAKAKENAGKRSKT